MGCSETNIVLESLYILLQTKAFDPLGGNAGLSINHIKSFISGNNTLVCYVSLRVYVCVIIQQTLCLPYFL